MSSLFLALQLKDKVMYNSYTNSSLFRIPTHVTQRPENHMHFSHPCLFKYANSANLTTIPQSLCLLPPVCSISKNLHFCLLNTRSVRNKVMVMKDFIVDNYIDILAMTETWLRPGTVDSVEVGTLCPTGYRVLHVPRSHSAGGGVGIIFKNSIRINTSLTDQFYLTADQRQKRLLIVRDFNIHVDNPNDTTARQFLDLLDCFNLVQHVSEKTHANGHTLDLVVSNKMDHFVNDVRTTDPVISDHLAVQSTLHLEKPRFVKKVVSSRKLNGIDVTSF